MERKTLPVRSRNATRSRLKAARALNEGKRFLAEWHRSRARGQIDRFDQVRECGGQEVVVSCDDCGNESRRTTAWCSHWRLCIACRSRRALEYRQRFRHARAYALSKRAWLKSASAPGGAWGEKFLTLTLPHSGDVRKDLATLPKAWRSFWKRLREHLELDRKLPASVIAQLVYVRVMEVTAGRKHDGHAHLHVYLFAPYLHHEVLGALWGRSLARLGYEVGTRPLADVLDEDMPEFRRAQLRRFLVTRRGRGGKPLDPVPNPVDHIETCYGDIEAELVKYLIKDAVEGDGGDLKLVDPEFFALVYEGMEGRKTVQTSLGFWVEMGKDDCRCRRCGSGQLSRRIQKAKPPSDEPPAWSEMDRPPAEWATTKEEP